MNKKSCYWKVLADDYHNFELAKDFYKMAGIKTKFVEVGTNKTGKYIAVFWIIGSKFPKEEIKKLKEKFSRED